MTVIAVIITSVSRDFMMLLAQITSLADDK